VEGENKETREIRKAKHWAIVNKACNLWPLVLAYFNLFSTHSFLHIIDLKLRSQFEKTKSS